MKASDVKHALYNEHGVDGQTEQQTAREALNHAGERGYVDTSGVTYEWGRVIAMSETSGVQRWGRESWLVAEASIAVTV